MTESPNTPKNVIDMGRHRRSQRTLQGASAGGPGSHGKKKKFVSPGKVGSRWRRVGNYLQLFLFLILLAYMMRVCRGGGGI